LETGALPIELLACTGESGVRSPIKKATSSPDVPCVCGTAGNTY